MTSLKTIVIACIAVLAFCRLGFATGPYYYTGTLPPVPNYSSSSQGVFWNSSNTQPEQSVLVSGAFSTEAKSVLMVPLGGVTNVATAFASPPPTSATVPASGIANTGLTFTVPSTFTPGPFAYKIQDSGSIPIQYANLPTIYWTEGTIVSPSAATAPLHPVLANVVEAGGSLRILGRDFPPTSYVAITVSGYQRIYKVSTQDPYEIVLPVSATQIVGTGTVQVGASITMDATYGAAQPITVTAASTTTSASVTCPALSTDDGQAAANLATIQACLDANPAPANTAEFIDINTAGIYPISGTLTVHPHQYLVNTSVGTVSLLGYAGTVPATWITGSSYFGLINVNVEAPLATGTASIVSTDATNGGHVLLYGSTITADSGISTSLDVSLAGPDLQIINSTITGPSTPVSGGNGVGMALLFGQGVLISNTVINLGSLQWNYLNDCQDVIIENSQINGLNTTTLANGSSSGISYIEGGYGGSIDENIYLGNSTISNIFGNDREAITLDGGGCDYEGLLSSSSASTMTLANTPNFYAGGGYTRTPTDCIVAILAGTGQGQYRFISAMSGNTVTISQPWTVQPDTTTSVVTICGRNRHLIFYGNTISNAGYVQLYGSGQDCEIANNTFLNTPGILLNSLLYGGAYQVIVNNDVVNNSLYLTTANNPLGTTTSEISMEGFTTGLISGTLVRGNVGPSNDLGTSPPSGFLVFGQGGAYTRIFSTLEEDESAPTGQAANIQKLNPAALFKESNLVTAAPKLGTLINPTAGSTYGVQFTVGTRPITVTQLGRWNFNNTRHVVGLYTTSGTLLASATTPTQNENYGKFVYAPLSPPQTLAANTSYYLESTEVATDQTSDYATTVVCPGQGITIDSAVMNHTPVGSENSSYGPVDLVFNTEMPMVQTVSSYGTLRNNATQIDGANFTVGPNGLIVTQLGRWVVSGNQYTHLLQLYNASTNTPVSGASVTVATSGVNPGQFAWGKLASPVSLAPGTYFLDSSETAGGDYWYDSGTVVNPGAGFLINGAEASLHIVGTANNSYIPVNLLSTFP